MQQTMPLLEQQASVAALRSCLATGMPAAEAVEKLAEFQPAYADQWLEIAKDVSNGRQLSAVLQSVWPEAAISAIRAGEESGKIVPVLENLAKTIQIQREVRAELSKLLYPVAVLLGAFVVFATMLITFVPNITLQLQRAVGNYGQLKGAAGFGLATRHFLVEHWIVSIVVLVVGISALVHWLRQPATIREMTKVLSDLPLIGPGLYQLWFGLWASYVAMAFAAGLPTIDALKATINVLPEAMRAGVRSLITDLSVRHMPMDRATNVKEMQEGDPRRKWPFFLRRAFAVAAHNGELDLELYRVAPEMIFFGKEEVKKTVKYGYVVAMAAAAAMIASAMILFYVPMMDVFSRVM